MNTLATWMNLTAALTAQEDWKTICKLSIAFGNEYIDYYNKEMPKPIKRGDVFKIRTYDSVPQEDKTELDIDVHKCVIANITKKKQKDNTYKYSVGFHHLVGSGFDSDSDYPDSDDNIVLACPLVRPSCEKSIPLTCYVVLSETEMFCESLKFEHFFGSIEYKKIM
jgi:hypothetical protein